MKRIRDTSNVTDANETTTILCLPDDTWEIIFSFIEKYNKILIFSVCRSFQRFWSFIKSLWFNVNTICSEAEAATISILEKSKNVQILDIYGSAYSAFISDEKLIHIPLNVTTLDISNSKINGEGLKHLSMNIRKLDISRSLISNESLLHLYQKNIKKLNLSLCLQLTDKGLENIPMSVESLNLNGCQKITDNGLKYLCNNTIKSLKLRGINDGSGISDIGVAFLPMTIRKLNISYGGLFISDKGFVPSIPIITDEGLKKIPSDIISLNINHCRNITNIGMRNLPRNIQCLDISFCDRISDDGLKDFPTHVISLNIRGCKSITYDGLSTQKTIHWDNIRNFM